MAATVKAGETAKLARGGDSSLLGAFASTTSLKFAINKRRSLGQDPTQRVGGASASLPPLELPSSKVRFSCTCIFVADAAVFDLSWKGRATTHLFARAIFIWAHALCAYTIYTSHALLPARRRLLSLAPRLVNSAEGRKAAARTPATRNTRRLSLRECSKSKRLAGSAATAAAAIFSGACN